MGTEKFGRSTPSPVVTHRRQSLLLRILKTIVTLAMVLGMTAPRPIAAAPRTFSDAQQNSVAAPFSRQSTSDVATSAPNTTASVQSSATTSALETPASVAMTNAASPRAQRTLNTWDPVLRVTKSASSEPLLGGHIGYGISVGLTGDDLPPSTMDKIYNVSISDTLQVGLTYSSASPEPDRVVKNPDGTTTLYWNDIQDLNVNDGLGVSVDAIISPTATVTTALVNKAGAWGDQAPDGSAAGITSTAVITAFPQHINITKSVVQSTGVNQATGASGWEATAPGTNNSAAQWPFQYVLSVQNNAITATNSVVVTDVLPPGVAYMGNATPLPTNIINGPGNNLTLVWNIGNLSVSNYTTPVVITVPVAIPYAERTYNLTDCVRVPNSSSFVDPGCFNGPVIADGSGWGNTQYNASGRTVTGQATGDGAQLLPVGDPGITTTARYLTMAKGQTPGIVGHGDIINYSLHYYVSEYYTMTNVVITDSLQDGLLYVPNSSVPAEQSYTYNAATGVTVITYTIPANATTPGKDGFVTLKAQVQPKYHDGRPVVSADSLTNLAAIAGDWTDDVNPARPGTRILEATSSSAGTYLPQIDKTVRDPFTGLYTNSITATIGQVVRFRLVFTAPQTLDVKNPVVQDFLPRGMYAVKLTGPSSTYSAIFSPNTSYFYTPAVPVSTSIFGLNLLTWDFGFITKTAVFTAEFDARVLDIPTNVSGLVIKNFGKFSASNTNLASYSLREIANNDVTEPDLVMTKKVVPSSGLVGGQSVTYTYSIVNNGTSPAFQMIVTDTVPYGMKFAANCGNTNASPDFSTCTADAGAQSGNGGTITWTPIYSFTGLAVGAIQLFTYTAVISAGLPASYSMVNIASVGYNSLPLDEPDGRPYLRNGSVDAANTDDAVDTSAAPVIVKSTTPAVATLGDIITYTLNISVPAGLSLPNATITDTIQQDGLKYNGAFIQAVSGSPDVPAAIGSSVVNVAGTGSRITWNLGNINNGSSNVPYNFNLVFTVTVDGLSDSGSAWVFFLPNPTNSTYPLNNSAILAWQSGAKTQTVTSNTTTNQIVQPLLSVTKTPNPSTGLLGGQVVTYTFVIANVGSSTAYRLAFTDTLPQYLKVPAATGTASTVPLITYSADAGAVAGTGGLITFAMPPSLPAGDQLTLVLTTTVVTGIVSFITLTNTADADWASQPAVTPGERLYDDPLQEAAWKLDTVSAVVQSAPLLTNKTVLPGTATNNTLRIGDIVTYTIVDTVPTDLTAYWPYQLDYLEKGFRYVPASFTFATSAPSMVSLIVNGTVQPAAASNIVGGNPNHYNPNVGAYSPASGQQAVEWWMTSIQNTSGFAQLITVTFKAQYVGTDMSGAVVYPPPDANSRAVVNSEQLFWNLKDNGAFGNTDKVNTPVAQATSYMGQPNLTLTKAALNPPAGTAVGANQLITYTLAINNNGPTPAYDINISETLPLSTTFVSASLATNYPGSVAPFATTLTSPSSGSTGSVQFGLDQVLGRENVPGVVSGNNSATKVVTITLTVLTDVDLGAGLTLVNTARVGYSDSQNADGTDADGNPTTPSQRVYVATPPSSVSHPTGIPVLTKLGTPSATIGEQVTFTLLVPATPLDVTMYNVILADAVNAALRVDATSFQNGIGGVNTTSGNNVGVSWTSIPSNTQATVLITATVLNKPGTISGTQILNNASFTYASLPGDPSNKTVNSNSTTTKIIMPNLPIVKTVATARTPVGAGDTVTYTIRLANNGNSPAYNVVITDALPTGVSFSSVIQFADTNPVTAILAGTYPTWTASQINVGGVVTITFSALVDAAIGAQLTLTNTTQAYYSTMPLPNPDARPLTTTLASAVIQTPLPSLTKLGVPTATIGQQITYTILVPTVPLTATMYNVSLLDTINPALRVDDMLVIGGVGAMDNSAGNSIFTTWTSIPANTQAMVVVTATVLNQNGTISGTQITNNARFNFATSPGGTLVPSINSNTTTTTIVMPNLPIVKTVATARTPVGAGDTVTYTIRLANNGNSPAYNVTITDALPAGVSFSSVIQFADTNPVTATLAGTYPTWTASEINVGGVVTITFSALVDVAIGAQRTLTNTTQAYYSTMPLPNPDARPLTTTLASAVIQTPLPSLSKFGVPTATIGQQITYTILIPTVPLTATMYNVALTDNVPATLRVDGVGIVGGNGAVNTTNLNNVAVTWTSVPAGTQAVVVVTATVLNQIGTVSGTQIVNNASFNFATTPGGNLVGSINSNSTTTTIIMPNLPIAKTVATARNPVGAGDTVTYTITLMNNGNSPAYNVAITDALPANITFSSVVLFEVSNPLAAVLAGTYPNWSVSQINVGGAVTITFLATADMPIGSNLVLTNTTQANYWTMPLPNGDARPLTTSLASAPITTGKPAFSMVKLAQPNQAVAGLPVTFTMQLTNIGIVTATGVVITDKVPAGTTFVSASSPFSGPDGNGIVTWSLGSMNVNESKTVTLTVLLGTGYAGSQLPNTAFASGVPGITATASVIVPVVVIGSVSGTVYHDVNGNATLDSEPGIPGVVVTLTTSTGQVLVTTVDSNGFYSFSGIPGGPFTVTVGTVPAGFTPTTPGQINGNLPAGGSSPNNNFGFILRLDLGISKTDGVATTTPGATITYTIVVTNGGPQAVQNAPVMDTLPVGIASAVWTCVAGTGATCGSTAGLGSIATTVNLNAGARVTFTVVAVVSGTATGSIVNTAVVTVPVGVVDPVPGNNTATDTDTLSNTVLTGVVYDSITNQPIPGATVVVTDSAGHVYTIVTGPDARYTVTNTVSTPLAPGVANISASAPGYLPDSTTKTVVGGIVNVQDLYLTQTTLTGIVTDTLTLLPIPGATVIFTDSTGSVFTMLTDVNGRYTFTSTVEKPIHPGVGNVTSAKTGYETATGYTPGVTIVPGANVKDAPLTPQIPILQSTKRDSLIIDADNNGIPSPGDTLIYTIVVTNAGNGPATGVFLNDITDPNATLVVGSVTTSQGSVTSGNNTGNTSVAINFGTLPAYSNMTITFRVLIANPLPAGVTQVANQAFISSNELPVVPTDDPDTPQPGDPTVTPVSAAPVLVATKVDALAVDADNNGVPSPGDTIVYTVTIANNGNGAATGVVFNDTPGANTTLVTGTVTTTQGSVINGNGAADSAIGVNIGTIAGGGATVRITFRVKIVTPLPTGVTQVANQGTVSSNQLPVVSTDDPDTAPVGDPTVTPVVAAPVINSTKTAILIVDADDNGVPSPGDTLLYQVIINNTGNTAATGVTFGDTPGANTTLVTGTVQTSQGSVTSGNSGTQSTVAVNVGVIPVGGTVIISFRVRVANPLPAGVTSVANQGFINSNQIPAVPTDDPSTPPVGDPTVTPLSAVPVLASTKTASLAVDADNNGVPSPGDTLLYQVNIVNSGNTAATGVTFADTPGANTSLVTGTVQTSAGSVTSGNAAGQTSVGVNIGTIPGGNGSVNITFRVKIANPLPAGVTKVANQGFINSTELPVVPTDDPSTPAPGDPTVTPLTAAPILASTKTASLAVDADNNGVPSPGDTLLYNVTIVNSGNTAATGVTFADTPGANTTLVTGTVQTNVGSVTSGNAAGQTSVGVNVGTLPGGNASVNISFRVKIVNPLPAGVTQVANQGTINSNELPVLPTDDPSTPAPGDPTVTPLTAAPILASTKTASLAVDADNNGVASPGDTLLYNVTIVNSGNTAATGVTFADTPGVNTTLVTGTVQTSAGSVTSGNGALDAIVGVNIGTLPGGGGSATISFRVKIVNPLPTGVTQVANQGQINSNELPVVPTDDPQTPTPGDPTVTPVTAAPILASTKTASLAVDADNNGVPSPGDTLLYNIAIVNSGNTAATGVTFADTPGANTTLVTGTVQTSVGSVTTGNGAADASVAVNIGTVAANTTVNISFRVKIANPLPTGVTQVANQGFVNSNQLPVVPTDDPQTPAPGDPTVTPLTAAPVLASTKTASLVVDADNNGVPSPGDTLLYQVNIINSGNTAATGVTFADTPGANTTLVTGTVQTSVGSVTSGNATGQTSVGVNIGTIPGGGSVVNISFRVKIANPVPAGVTQVANQGFINSNELPPVPTDDPRTTPVGDPTVTPLATTPVLAATKTATLAIDADNNGVPSPGDTILYKVTLVNSGNTAASGVIFTDTPGVNTTLVTGTVQTSQGSVTSGNADGQTTVGVNVGTIPGGNGTATITFRVKIANPLPAGVTQVANQGVVSSNELPTIPTDDPQTPTPGDPTVTPVVSAPVLSSSKTASLAVDADNNGVPSPGDTLLYNVIIVNSGNSAATGVTFTDTPGVNTTLVTGTVQTSAGSVTSGNATGQTSVGVNIGTIPGGGASVNISFRVKIANPVPAGVTQVANQGFVYSTQLPTVPTDDPGTPTPGDPTVTPITSAPVLAATKTASLIVDADNNGVPSPGDTILYQVTVVNNGNSAATGVTFADTPGVNTTLVTGTVQTSQGSVTAGNGATDTSVGVTIGTLPGGGASVSISFRVKIVNPLPIGVTQVANQGTVNSNELPVVPTDDPQTPAPGDPTVTPVVAAPVIAASKTSSLFADADNDGVPSPGDTLLYQVVIVNNGNTAATGVTFADTPGANTTLVNGTVQTSAGSVTNGNGPSDTAVGVNIGTLPAGSSVVITFRVKIANPVPAGVTQVVNQGVVSSNQLPNVPTDDPTTPPPGDPTVTPITAVPVLHASKTAALVVDADNNGVPSPGDTLLYQVQIQNSGNAAATGVVFTDTPGANTTLLTGTVQTSAGSVTLGNGATDTSVSVNIGTIAGGGTLVNITFRVMIANPLPPGVTQVANQGFVSSPQLPTVPTDDPTTTPPGDPTVTPVIATTALALFKTVSPAQAIPGELLTYTLTYTVSGNATALNVTLRDPLPANTTFVSCSGAPCSQSNGAVVWTLGNVPPVFIGSVTMIVRVTSVLPNGILITNTATITDAGGLIANAQVVVPVVSSHLLSVIKTALPSPVDAGGLLTYTINWSVTGNEPANDVTLNDPLPANTTYVNCAGAPCAVNGNTVTWSLGAQNPPANGAVTLVVQVDKPLFNGTLIANTVYVSDTTGITNTSTVTTPVASSHQLTIVKTAAPSPVDAGGLLTYTIAYTVTGNEPAANLTVRDNVPANTSFVSCNGTPCSQNNGEVVWSLGTVNPPANGLLSLVVKVADVLPNGTLIANTVYVSDTTGITNTSTVTTPVASDHQLAVSKHASAAEVEPGDLLTYTINYTVTGNEPAPNVVITDALPAGVTALRCDPQGCQLFVGAVVWHLGTINPAAYGMVTVVVQVNSDVVSGTQLLNTVIIADGLGKTDDDVVTTPVIVPFVALDVNKTANPPNGTLVKMGDLITYTITVTNVGSATATNVMITDGIPDETQYVANSAVPTPFSGPDPLVWKIPSLAPFQPYAVSFTVRVMTMTHEIINVGQVTADDVVPVPTPVVVNPPIPSAVMWSSFGAAAKMDSTIALHWMSFNEIGVAGFNLYRSTDGSRDGAVLVNAQLIQASGLVEYEYVDADVQTNVTYTYWLQQVRTDNTIVEYGAPVIVTNSPWKMFFLPFVSQ